MKLEKNPQLKKKIWGEKKVSINCQHQKDLVLR